MEYAELKKIASEVLELPDEEFGDEADGIPKAVKPG
jgi:hypothetical protein